MFFKLGNYGGNFADDMLKKKIILRSLNYPEGKFARVSIGTMDEMKEFIRQVKKV